ncbi:heme peroxidase [Microdochium bolleyi]|uniref:Heme peroxidase n=1 Tax=Microdochium bolleyi TaxID=196109 RepID=A0A136IZ54_9PEZI|nr:heme peroxidase [Microdochium bolleyi]
MEDPQGEAPFFSKLPADIRIQIYELYTLQYTPHAAETFTPSLDDWMVSEPSQHNGSLIRFESSLADSSPLAQTCRKAMRELDPIMAKDLHFTFGTPKALGAPCCVALHTALSLPDRVTYPTDVRRLHLEWRIADGSLPQSRLHFVRELLRIRANLGTAALQHVTTISIAIKRPHELRDLMVSTTILELSIEELIRSIVANCPALEILAFDGIFRQVYLDSCQRKLDQFNVRIVGGRPCAASDVDIRDECWARAQSDPMLGLQELEAERNGRHERHALNRELRVSSALGTISLSQRQAGTAWLDLSALYGSTREVAMKLRPFKDGKLLTQEATTRGTKKGASYLPFNSMSVPQRSRPGVNPESLFAGGDPRTNEDWLVLGVDMLILREHNRMCDILKQKKPGLDDDELFQTARVVVAAKFSLVGNAYQMAYFKDMPWPSHDGWLEVNPVHNYPYDVVLTRGKPTVASAEMAVVYRFHELIVKSFPVKDAHNETRWEQNLFATAFNATGFLEGLENILRGSLASTISNFKSGIDEDVRSAGRYRGMPFDIVVWSLVDEREQWLPAFNDYFRAYNKGSPGEDAPALRVTIRERFEDFSSDPHMVAELRRLYKDPDEVDLVVGCQLDESLFPHITVPISSLIISLFSLISMGMSDRFSVGTAAMRCVLVDKPWDWHPSNALEDLLWRPLGSKMFPGARFYDEFWLDELDFQAYGQNLLWRLVTENTEIDCLQRNTLFQADETSNPVVCALAPSAVDIILTLATLG